MSDGWIGVDLDGTLAHYDGFHGAACIGAPVPKMVERVKTWLDMGRDVRIFTARVSHDGSTHRVREAMEARRAIEAWCLQHLGVLLPVTNEKDWRMDALWDDRAVQVIKNAGIPWWEAE